MNRDASLPTSNTVFNSLPANKYWLVVTDAKGCRDSIKVIITQPKRLEAIFITLNCDDGSGNGKGKLVHKESGKAYLWGADTIISDLKAGKNYSVTISDGTCFQRDSFSIARCIVANMKISKKKIIFLPSALFRLRSPMRSLVAVLR